MSGYLTTHVLDTAKGKPAQGLAIELFRLAGDARVPICVMITNEDGRTDVPILPESDFETGEYELIFKCADYLGDAAFLGDVPIRFKMSDQDHYHVPLLLSPYGYSTYRGS